MQPNFVISSINCRKKERRPASQAGSELSINETTAGSLVLCKAYCSGTEAVVCWCRRRGLRVRMALGIPWLTILTILDRSQVMMKLTTR